MIFIFHKLKSNSIYHIIKSSQILFLITNNNEYTVYMKKTVLCIIDGLGYSARESGNAVTAAGMPNLMNAMKNHPSCYIKASGKEVGLDSDKDAGNSEVGHNAMGAGKTIKQGLSLLNSQFATGEIFATETWKTLASKAKKQKLNIITLLSDGRVHSDIAHLYKVLAQCKKEDITVSLFAVTDGRDVPPQSAVKYIEETQAYIKEIGVNAKFAAVGGRGRIFMDRYESQPELLTRAYEVCVEGEGEIPHSPTVIEQFYEQNPTSTDEHLPAFICDKTALIKNGDAVLLLNYRGDRAIETCAMFETGKYITPQQFAKIKNCYFAGILQYDAEKQIPKNFLCPPPKIENVLTEWLCRHGVKQYTVTETVKFGHLTYFFNGNRQTAFDSKLETWCEIPSDKLNNEYNKAPKMKAAEICGKLIFNLRHGNYDFYKCNFPNPDMVGHTGDFNAAVAACQFCDKQIGRLYEVCKTDKINLIITADHGNAEEMTDEKGNIKTSHTNNPVPFVICPFAAAVPPKIKAGEFGLTNIASVICSLLGLAPSPTFNESII
jgi:2,3-bisphosphoglycerate-independent phosphoglycerate mutase